MKSFLRTGFLLTLTVLTSCSYDRKAGIAAAHKVGADYYLSFQRNGKPDSGALFHYANTWWFYHPICGSNAILKTPSKSNPPLTAPYLSIPGIEGKVSLKLLPPVEPKAEILNGCLVKSIEKQRQSGSIIAVRWGEGSGMGHAWTFAPEERLHQLLTGTGHPQEKYTPGLDLILPPSA